MSYRKHLFIPDTQCMPDVPTDHLKALSRYIMEKRPDVIIHAGDHWDFPSCSRHQSVVEKTVKRLSVKGDIQAGNEGLAILDSEIVKWNKRRPAKKHYKPKKHFTKGNHDEYLIRAARQEPHIYGDLIEEMDFRDWKVHPFLVPVNIDGVLYAHYFARNAKGAVTNGHTGAPSARAQVMREGISCTAGHKQGLDTCIQPIAEGRRRRGIIAGSFYMHDLEYKTPQGQNHWRGVLLKHEVRDGDYDLCEVSMAHLLRAYS